MISVHTELTRGEIYLAVDYPSPAKKPPNARKSHMITQSHSETAVAENPYERGMLRSEMKHHPSPAIEPVENRAFCKKPRSIL